MRRLLTLKNLLRTLLRSVWLHDPLGPLVWDCAYPLQAQANPPPRQENPEKQGKLTKFPSLAPPPKKGKITPKNYKMVFSEWICNLSVSFPLLQGRGKGGKFCNFSLYFRIFSVGGLPGPVYPLCSTGTCNLPGYLSHSWKKGTYDQTRREPWGNVKKRRNAGKSGQSES